MKTRDRILQASLLLFNDEGEVNVTTVDVANELDISPGNLYYHFRGKDIIVNELFDLYEYSMGQVLQALIDREFTFDDAWLYLYLVFEEAYKYRFVYQSPAGMMQRYPELQLRFKRLLTLKSKAGVSLITALLADERSLSKTELANHGELFTLLLTFWLSFSELRRGDDAGDDTKRLWSGVRAVIASIEPLIPETLMADYRNSYRNLPDS